MDMNSMYLEDKRVSVYSLGTQFIYAWASLLSSYLEGQCEGLDPWDGNKAGSGSADFPGGRRKMSEYSVIFAK